MEHNPPQISSTAKPNWWKQNWKWFVPLGCFSIAVLFLIFIGSVAFIVFSAVKSTDVYKEALARAKTHPEVIEVLGSPITEGFLVSGNTNVKWGIPRSQSVYSHPGPKGNGTIYVAARKSLGQCNYSGLVVEIAKTHQRIDLLHSPIPANSR